VNTFSSSRAARLGVWGTLTVLALILLTGGLARAQVSSGSISGTAIDPSGAVIPGVQVKVINTGTGSVATTTTDGAGLFRVSELQIGTYSLEFTKQSFSKYVVNNVVVTAGTDQGVGLIKLAVGASTVTVEVTEAPPLLETTEAQVSTTFTTQQITSFAGLQENEGMDFLALQIPGVNTVSYTHLDVYKRQGLGCPIAIANPSRSASRAASSSCPKIASRLAESSRNTFREAARTPRRSAVS